jgi:hypothetical protein
MIETGYYCKECGAPAVIEDGKIVRSCEHTGTVIADCQAVVSQDGGVSA